MALTGVASAQEATVPLRAGWNPVAFPGVRLNQLSTSAPGLASYDGAGYQLEPATLATVNAGEGGRRGFWFYSPAAGNVSYRAEGEASFVDLRAGWNLISSATSTVVTPTVPTGTLIYSLAEDGTSTPFDGKLQPARAYWVFATSAGRLTWSTVSTLRVVPEQAVVRRYGAVQLEAFADGLPALVEWSSEAPSSLAVSATGLATGLFPGTYTVTARLQGKTSTSRITVTDAGTPGPVGPTPTPSPSPSPSPVAPPLGPWTTRTSGTAQSLRAVTWGGPGRFVAVGDNGTGLYSSDGITWTGSTGLTVNMQSIGANGNGFFAGGADATRYTSTDGITFTFAGSSTATDSLLGAAFGNGFGVFVGREFGLLRSLTSGNALPFSAGYGGSTTPGLMQAVTFGLPAGRAVAVGVGGVIAQADVTTATPTWTTVTSPTSVTLNGVAHGAGAFVAAGQGGRVVRSVDGGLSFSLITSPSSANFWAVTYGNSEFMAVGEGGIVMRSPDGVTWTAESAGTSATLRGVAWSGTRYVAVGTGGVILTSP